MIVFRKLSKRGGEGKVFELLVCIWRFFIALLLTATISLEAIAQEEIYFSISQTSADIALKAYAQQSQRQVLYPFDLVIQYESNEVEGYFSADAALLELFKNTGLHASVDENQNLVVRVATKEEKNMLDNKKKTVWSLAGAIASVFAAGGSAVAQETETQSSGFALEEITVTARKVRENMQDVPVSVSAFSAEALERRQINGTDDIGKITPNLQFTNNAPLAGNNNSSVIFIRGVGQISPRANTDPGVGLYIDDVYMGQSVGGAMELRDISGIQVLRGPQGTLFGRNTIGGAVLISTTEPGDEMGGKFRIGTGDDNLMEVFGAVDLPISDTLKTRFSLGSKKQDGYVIRLFDGTDLGDVNNTTFTGKMVWEATDTFTAKLNLDYTEADENGSALVFADINNNSVLDYYGADNAGWIAANQSVGAGCSDAWVVSAGGPPFRPIEVAGSASTLGPNGNGQIGSGGGPRGYVSEALNDPRCANNFQNAGPFANNGTGPVGSTLENKGMSLDLSLDLNATLTLKSITSFRQLEWTGKRDADNTPLTILHTDYASDGDQFSQELQLTYEGDSLTGVFGLYYYEEEIVDTLTPSVGDKPAGNFCGTVDRCHIDSDNNVTENESFAVFAQFSYDISDRLHATLGVRHTEETKASTPEQFDWTDSVNGDSASVNSTPTAGQVAGTEAGWGDFYLEPKRYELDFSATTLAANLSYDFSDNGMIYTSYSEGFKGGGFNSTFNFPLFLDEISDSNFEQEEVKTVEFGFKADLTNNFRINGAIFSSEYENLQFAYRVFIAPWLLNAGEASMDGAELELTWVPSESWIIEAGLGFLDSSIDEAVEVSVGGAARSLYGSPAVPLATTTGVAVGNQLPFAPEMQGNLGIGYNVEMGDMIISPRVDISFSDGVYFDASNSTQIAQNDAYTTVDLSVAFENYISGWKVVAGLNNATDETYRLAGNSSLSSGTGYAEVAYARPRMWFANFSKEF